MPGRIAEALIQQILGRVNLVDLVGRQVKLRKVGANWGGLCPFHSDKKASFYVNPVKGFYYCFGCHEAGNAIGFLMKSRGMAFQEAVESLAEVAGVEVVYEDGVDAGAWRKAREKRKAMLDVNAEANAFFRSALHGPEGRQGMEYVQGRGIDPKLVARFQMGYATGGTRLYDHFVRKGVPLNFAQELGLIATPQRGGPPHDKFHERVMFPVLTAGDEVAGFSGRAIVPELEPKYLNSPESEVFKKGDLLFGLVQAREAVKKRNECILVEGQVDVLSMHQGGFENCVAPLGTALTKEQCSLLRRFTESVAVMFDGDSAGRKATWRALPMLMAEGLYGRVVRLPDGEDPDSMLKRHGADALARAVEKGKPYLEFAVDTLLSHAKDSLHGRSAAAKKGMEFAREIVSPIDRKLFLQRLAAELALPVEALQVEAAGGAVREAAAVGGEPLPARERSLVELVVMKPDLVRVVEQEGVFESVHSESVRSFLAAVLDQFEESGTVDMQGIVSRVTDARLRDLCARVLIEDRRLEDPALIALANDVTTRMRRERLVEEQKALSVQMRRARDEKDEAEVLRLAGRYEEVDRELAKVSGLEGE